MTTKTRIALIAVILSCGAMAEDISFGFKSKWSRSKVYLKPAKEGFVYNCFKYYSEMSTSFKDIKLAEQEQITLSFKIKGKGELKPDRAGLRFGLYGKNSDGKLAGYVVNFGTAETGCALQVRSLKADKLLSGKGFKGIRGAKSGNIGSDKFSELKFVITNLGNDELEFQLLVDSMLTIKCKRSNMPVASFDKLALGTGGKVNSFIIKDLIVAKTK